MSNYYFRFIVLQAVEQELKETQRLFFVITYALSYKFSFVFFPRCASCCLSVLVKEIWSDFILAILL